MPINDIDHGLRRVGKLRMGEQVPTNNGNTRPSKLDTWRVTSADRAAVEAVAAAYGGQVKPWDNDGAAEFEVVTETATLDVLITPETDAFSQFYEQWSAGGCQRRCDGFVEQLSGGACVCPTDHAERSELAKTGKACKATTRVSVVLPLVAALGSWMVESHGYYAARELGSTFALLDLAGARRSLLPAKLRIEQRTSKKPGEKPNHYGVPVLDIAMSIGSLIGAALPPAGVDGATGEIGPFDTPALEPAAPVTSVKAAETRKSTRKLAAEIEGADEPITDDELAAFKARIGVLDDQHRSLCAHMMNAARVNLKRAPTRSQAATCDSLLCEVEVKQAEAWETRRKAVFAALNELNADMSDAERHQFIADATGGATDSTKTLTQDQANAVIETATGVAPEQQELGGDAA